MIATMPETTARSGRKPGAKTYPAAFVSAHPELRQHFKALDDAMGDFKKATAADRRLERQIRGKSKDELSSMLTDAEKRARLLRDALRASNG